MADGLNFPKLFLVVKRFKAKKNKKDSNDKSPIAKKGIMFDLKGKT